MSAVAAAIPLDAIILNLSCLRLLPPSLSCRYFQSQISNVIGCCRHPLAVVIFNLKSQMSAVAVAIL
jgi:hypothetical protein